MTNFVFCFCFLSSSLEKIQKEKGREETWERGNRFISSTRSLFLREETHQSHAHERTRRIINRAEHSNTLFVRSKRFYRCCCSSSSSSRNKRKIQKRTNFWEKSTSQSATIMSAMMERNQNVQQNAQQGQQTVQDVFVKEKIMPHCVRIDELSVRCDDIGLDLLLVGERF